MTQTISSLCAVITTIQEPTAAVHALHRRLQEFSARMVVAGDRKGPAIYDLSNCDFLSLRDQQSSDFTLAGRLPVGHYARKNIGYLHAIRAGAACIYETDDDNEPLPRWQPRSEHVDGLREVGGDLSGWVNVYRYFSDDPNIWPRGFPLDGLSTPVPEAKLTTAVRHAPIQQGLANHSPDVDAIWRLTQDRPFDFQNRPSVWLGPGWWCPFNTQSTWWWPVVYPLLYVPSHCSFRMCDIWKSFIAQRCLWELGSGVVFHAPEVRQERNPHDLLRDFKDEIPGYLQNTEIINILTRVSLRSGVDAVGENLRACYAALATDKIFPPEEMPLVDAWLSDLRMKVEM